METKQTKADLLKDHIMVTMGLQFEKSLTIVGMHDRYSNLFDSYNVGGCSIQATMCRFGPPTKALLWLG